MRTFCGHSARTRFPRNAAVRTVLDVIRSVCILSVAAFATSGTACDNVRTETRPSGPLPSALLWRLVRRHVTSPSAAGACRTCGWRRGLQRGSPHSLCHGWRLRRKRSGIPPGSPARRIARSMTQVATIAAGTRCPRRRVSPAIRLRFSKGISSPVNLGLGLYEAIRRCLHFA